MKPERVKRQTVGDGLLTRAGVDQFALLVAARLRALMPQDGCPRDVVVTIEVGPWRAGASKPQGERR